MSMDPKSAAILLVVIAIIGSAVFIADAVIFIRWITYLWEKYRVEEAAAKLTLAEAAHLSDRQARVAAGEATPSFDLSAGEQPLPEAPYSMAYGGDPVLQLAEAAPALPQYPFARTWSLVDPWLAFQFVFIVSQVVITLAILPLLFAHGALNTAGLFSPAGIFIQCVGLFFMNGLFVGVTAFYLHRYGKSLASIGLGRPDARWIATGCCLGLILFAVASGAEIAMNRGLPLIIPKPVMDGLVKLTKDLTAGGMFDNIQSLNLKIFFALAGAVAAPIGEEVFFRGFLYNAFKRKLNVNAAIVLSGLIFALVHFGPLAILVIFPMGMALAYVYEKTQSLWVTICMHATHNGLTFVLAMAFPHLGESPKEPVKPAAPPSRPAIVHSVPARVWGDPIPPYRGVTTHA